MIDEENQVDATHGSMDEMAESTDDPTTLEAPLPTLDELELPEDDDTDVSLETGDALEAGKAAELSALLAQKDEELQSTKAQLDEFKSQYMRIAADFDNYRKRTQREKDDLEQQIKCSTINELLPVVDNFERARSQIKPQTDQETTIHKSYQSVYKQLVDCLKRIGVSPMRAEGKEFDPNLHEAVMREATSEHPEGTVMEELQRGYLLGERVLRHALVKVAAAPEPVISSEESNPTSSDD